MCFTFWLRPKIKPGTFRSQVGHSNHYSTASMNTVAMLSRHISPASDLAQSHGWQQWQWRASPARRWCDQHVTTHQQCESSHAHNWIRELIMQYVTVLSRLACHWTHHRQTLNRDNRCPSLKIRVTKSRPLFDAVHWCGICYGDMAVCVSVTLMYCAQTTESIIMKPSPVRSPAILVFPYQT